MKFVEKIAKIFLFEMKIQKRVRRKFLAWKSRAIIHNGVKLSAEARKASFSNINIQHSTGKSSVELRVAF